MARKGQATTEPAVSILPAQQLSDSEDMTTHDFRDVVDILSTYARTDAAISKLMPARIAKGVHINCPGDMSATGQPRYVAAEVHTSMPVFVTSSLNCNITFILGLPLCSQQLPLDGDWCYDTSKTTNLPLLWLHFQVTGAATMIGDIPKLGFDKGGSALVVRAGGEDLLPEHLEVMCEFCSSVVDRVQSAMHRGDKKRIQQFAEKNVAKETYLAYWEDYQATKASTEEHWKDLPSPYDMELDLEDFRREKHPLFRAFKPMSFCTWIEFPLETPRKGFDDGFMHFSGTKWGISLSHPMHSLSQKQVQRLFLTLRPSQSRHIPPELPRHRASQPCPPQSSSHPPAELPYFHHKTPPVARTSQPPSRKRIPLPPFLRLATSSPTTNADL